VLGQLADFRLMCHRLIVLVTTLELDMANPKELQEAAEAIRNVRRLPAVQRHRQLEDLLQRSTNILGTIREQVEEQLGNRIALERGGKPSIKVQLR